MAAKRFTDSGKWERAWFTSLRPEFKLLWVFILDRCDHAGIWDVNWPVAEFFIGSKLNADEIARTFANHIVPLENGQRWFILDFPEFQYGTLNPASNPHRSVIATLQRYELLDEKLRLKPKNTFPTLTKPFPKGSPTLKDQDQDKDQDEDQDQDKDQGQDQERDVERAERRKTRSTGSNGIDGNEFNRVWAAYPRKSGRAAAEKAFRASVRAPDELTLFETAMANHLASVEGREQFTIGGARFFTEWKDWISPTETMMKRGAGSQSKLDQSRPSDFSKYKEVQIS